MRASIPQLTGPRLAPKGPAKQLVILLHGIGADGNDLIGLAPFYQALLPDALFVAPNAPLPFDIAPFGYQWFSIQDMQASTRLNGVRQAAPALDAFIDAELARLGLNENRLVLIGFSQGAMIALHVGLRRAEALAGIISHSGMLVGESRLAGEIRSRPPVLLTHGALDEVLPVQALPVAEGTLRAAGVPVEAHVMPNLGHGIDEATIRLDLEFLGKVFGVKGP